MERRSFIRDACAACMGMAGLGLLLESCGTSLPVLKTTSANDLITVPASRFEAGQNMLVVRSAQLENDILLIKQPEGYKALNMKCTHEGFGLTVTSKNLVCTAHGSTFDFNGKVLKEPALRDLREFRTQQSENNIIIHLT